ncbi:MAG: D-glycerate dehydrogenase [Nocardioidaceae bacterium]
MTGSAARIVSTRPLPPAAREILDSAGEVIAPDGIEPLTTGQLRELVGGADAIVSQLYDVIDGEVMDIAGDQLRIVANVAAGYNNLDVAAARERRIVITNTPGVLTDATADVTLGLILMVTRRLGEGERLLRRGDSWSWDLEFMLGTSLAGRTLGIVGFGQIGRAVAQRAQAFGMRVLHASARPGAALRHNPEASSVEVTTFDELLATSDIVSLHCPLTPDTHHLMDAARLAQMRPDAYLINTARGPVIDEAALLAALRAGHLAGAGLDVFEHEPEVSAGLLDLENVVAIPHLGSATREVRNSMAELAASNVAAVLRGGTPPTPVWLPEQGT